ncbi:MAG: cupin domain-containing protein [Bacteroidales bacterium]|nr:cupin domain-containing protein [Bacteroidales bacterium]
MHDEIVYWVEKLKLIPHPEGGFYREIYRSKEVLDSNFLGSAFEGKRNLSTAIYYLLTKGDFSAFHRIKSDEIWHFYAGESLQLHIIHPDGRYESKIVGNKPFTDEEPFVLVPGACWFAAIPLGEFALVGCTVAPGFAFEDFELAERQALIKLFPQHYQLIESLTRS